MADIETKDQGEEEILVDYDDEDAVLDAGADKKAAAKDKKGSYVGIHASAFRDFLLKSELLLAIQDCGFENPSQVQQVCIPDAIGGSDIICQAKSGMGKTAVFVISTLQQIEPVEGKVDTLVLCNTRELALQIGDEFERFTKYMKNVRIGTFFGGIPIKEHYKELEKGQPHIVIGTPGRILQLVQEKKLDLGSLQRFILDECDELLNASRGVQMRRDVQTIFQQTPHEKQVMMFSATLPKEVRPVCRKFCGPNTREIYVDNESKLTLHGLSQYYVQLEESDKNRKLNHLLDNLEINQVVIFVKSVWRAKELNRLLVEANFPSVAVYSGMKQEQRLERYKEFKNYEKRILVATDLFGRGVDFAHINIVINYDMPPTADQYLHRVGRSGRFGTKGLAVTFVSSPEDAKILEEVQSRFEVDIPVLPDELPDARV